MSASAFIGLLQSDEGLAFLEAVMTTMPERERAAWWRKLSVAAQRINLRLRQEALARDIGELTKAEEQLLLSID